MSVRRLLIVLSLTVFTVALILLLSGSKWLLISLSDTSNIPLGTFITWMGLISLPAIIFLGISRLYYPKNAVDKLFKKLIILTLIIAVLWVPVSYLLAGNISFTFGEKVSFQGGQTAMKWFWIFTYTIPGLSLFVFLLFGIVSAFRRKE